MDNQAGVEERLVEHARGGLLPRKDLSGGVCSVKLKNPLCGDEVTYSGVITANNTLSVSAEVAGCFVCKVAASIVAGELEGAVAELVESRLQSFRNEFTAGSDTSLQGDLSLLFRFRDYPQRVKCVLLPVDVASKLLQALSKNGA
jgi:NifU-like protein involved in Fe-S cluster formation